MVRAAKNLAGLLVEHAPEACRVSGVAIGRFKDVLAISAYDRGFV